MKTTPKIVALGGGELSTLETAGIDKHIIELTGKTQPKVLFISTASGDPPGYVAVFETCYGKEFKCQTRKLNLTQNPPRGYCGITSRQRIYALSRPLKTKIMLYFLEL